MITSLDYGGARNGGIVNSFTHTALPNNFATLPHSHHNNHLVANATPVTTGVQHLNHQQQQQQQQQTHVRFGTLPVRGNEKPPPPYPGNYHNGNNSMAPNGNAFQVSPLVSGPVVQLPQTQPIQTQVIYTAK